MDDGILSSYCCSATIAKGQSGPCSSSRCFARSPRPSNQSCNQSSHSRSSSRRSSSSKPWARFVSLASYASVLAYASRASVKDSLKVQSGDWDLVRPLWGSGGLPKCCKNLASVLVSTGMSLLLTLPLVLLLPLLVWLALLSLPLLLVLLILELLLSLTLLTLTLFEGTVGAGGLPSATPPVPAPASAAGALRVARRTGPITVMSRSDSLSKSAPLPPPCLDAPSPLSPSPAVDSPSTAMGGKCRWGAGGAGGTCY